MLRPGQLAWIVRFGLFGFRLVLLASIRLCRTEPNENSEENEIEISENSVRHSDSIPKLTEVFGLFWFKIQFFFFCYFRSEFWLDLVWFKNHGNSDSLVNENSTKIIRSFRFGFNFS